MNLFLERLLFFWLGITALGLLITVFFWAIKVIILIAFFSFFIAIVATLFYHFYWVKRDL